MKYKDIKYDLEAYLEDKIKDFEYCEEVHCGGQTQDTTQDETVQKENYHFDVLKDYTKYLPVSLRDQFLQKFNSTKDPYFTKEQVLTFGLLCQLDINDLNALLNKVGYTVDEECPYELTYIYFCENHIYSIQLLKEALKEIDKIYGD